MHWFQVESRPLQGELRVAIQDADAPVSVARSISLLSPLVHFLVSREE